MTTTTFDSGSASNVTLSGGALIATATGAGGARSADFARLGAGGKYYFEVTLNVIAANSLAGFGQAGSSYAYTSGPNYGTLGVAYNGYVYKDGVQQGSYSLGATVASDVICVAVDLGLNLAWFRRNTGNWNASASANPATGVGGIAIEALGFVSPFVAFGSSGEQYTLNAGATSYAETVPSGFANWPSPGAATAEMATQIALEVWETGVPSLRLTQIALEVWQSASTPGVSNALIVTQAALEVWRSVGSSTVVSGAGEADAAAIVTGVGAVVSPTAGAGEADASADVRGVGQIGIVGVGEADASADVRGVGVVLLPPDSLPFLPGLGWSVHRRPTFDTIVASHPSGAEVRLALWAAPLWEFELTYDMLASNAAYPGVGDGSLQTLMGFYLARGGQRGTFLFIDPDFNALEGQAFGEGDGATVAFPFQRVFGGFVEPISWVTATAAVYFDGAPVASGWQVSGATLTFDAPPAAGAIVSADFSYGFICRFLEDTLDFDAFMDNLWQMKSLKFRQVRL